MVNAGPFGIGIAHVGHVADAHRGSANGQVPDLLQVLEPAHRPQKVLLALFVQVPGPQVEVVVAEGLAQGVHIEAERLHPVRIDVDVDVFLVEAADVHVGYPVDPLQSGADHVVH